MLEVNS